MISGSYVHLKVQDTGAGIPADIMDQIFDPFFTTKREGKGTGIGLSVVHGIIQSHKGYITVNSKEGQGACFDVYLPVYQGPLKVEEPDKKESHILKGDERILLVEDDRKVALMVKFMLEQLGYQVSICLESPEALKLIKGLPDDFDLIITDLTMPDLTGYQLAERLHQIRPDIPVVLCTGFGESIDRQQIEFYNIRGILTKPVTLKDLSHTLRKILDRQIA
jgi:CheY-like chemotaxis protein